MHAPIPLRTRPTACAWRGLATTWAVLFAGALGAIGAAQARNDELPFADALRRNWSVESGLPQVSAVHLAQDLDGFVWIATEGGLARFDGSSFRVFDSRSIAGFSHDMVRRLHVDRDGRLWVASAGQLLRRDGASFRSIQHEGKDSGGHYAFAEDAAGVLWLGGPGLFRIDAGQLVRDPRHEGAVGALLADGMRLWIGGIDHIASLDADGYRRERLPGRHSGLRVNALARDDQRLWAATSQGLYLFEQDRWRHATEVVAAETPVHLVHRDARGQLWVSTDTALLRLRGGEVVEQVSRTDPGSFPWIVSALNDRDGNLWFGSQTEGLLRLRRDASRRYSSAAGLQNPFVWSFLPWGEDLLVGTNSGVAQLVGGRFERFADAVDLPNPVAMSLFRERSGRLWIGTRAGLASADAPAYRQWRSYPGVGHLQFNGFMQDRAGRLWAASSAGVQRFDGNDWVAPAELATLAQSRVRYLLDAEGDGFLIGTEAGLFHFDGATVSRETDALLGEAFITVLQPLRDGRLLVGTFNQGLFVGSPGHWLRLTQEQGLPAAGLKYAVEVGDHLLVSSLQGVYRVALDALQPGATLQTDLLIDDSGREPPGDHWRCCNGAGHDKGLLHAGRVWLPSLDGAIAFPLEAIGDAQAIPHPVIEGLEHGGQLAEGVAVDLPAANRNWRLAYTAPFFLRTGGVRFEYRMVGYDADWVAAGRRREAFYTNLPPGAYRFLVRAGLHGSSAFSEPVALDIRLQPFWYETPAARIAAVLLLLGAIWLALGARLRAMRVRQANLEQLVEQRTLELRAANQALQEAALTDPLTGLHNRRFLDQTVGEMLSHSEASHAPTVWIMIDADHFKRINDRQGHATGDAVLRDLSQLLSQELGAGDQLVRWGGEEFLLVIEGGERLLERIEGLRAAIRVHPWQARLGLPDALTVSIGIAWHPADLGRLPGWDWQRTVALADRALYVVKEGGRDSWAELRVTAAAPADFAERISSVSTGQLLADGWLALRRGPGR